MKKNEIDYKALEMAYDAAISCRFLKTREEIHWYASAVYKAIVWGGAMTNDGRIKNKGSHSSSLSLFK